MKFSFKGLDEYVGQLEALANDFEQIAGETIFEGAKIVADAVKHSIETNIPIDERPFVKDERKGISTLQKEGLLDGMGIAKMEEKDFNYNVKVGFARYNKVKTKKFPNGQPNVYVARMVESGTSYMPKTQFVTKALRSAKKQCEEKMKQTMEQKIEEIAKEK